MTARDRFTQTRQYVIELDTIKARLSEHGEEWQPEQVHVSGTSDPTANQAVYNVDVLGDVLDELRKREAWLENFIGVSLMVIDRVSKGLGEQYASILEQRYIDCLTWKNVSMGCSVSTGKRMLNVAFDWIDSLGLTKLERGDYEI